MAGYETRNNWLSKPALFLAEMMSPLRSGSQSMFLMRKNLNEDKSFCSPVLTLTAMRLTSWLPAAELPCAQIIDCPSEDQMGTSSLPGCALTNKVRSLRPSELATCNENSLCPSRLTTSRIKAIWLPSGETANLPSRPSMSFVGTPPINDTRYKALGSPLTNKRLSPLLSNPNPAIRSAVSSSTFVFDASCRTQISTEFCERRV